MLKTFNESRSLYFWLAILLAIGFAVTSLVSYYVSRNSIRHSIAAEELPLTMDNVYSDIQNDLIRPIFVSSMMAKNTFVKHWVESGEHDPDQIARYLKEIQQQNGTLTAYFVSAKSRLYYYEDGILKERLKADSRFSQASTGATPYEISVSADEAHQLTPALFIHYRMVDQQGHLLGITGVGLTITAMQAVIDSYRERYQRNLFFADKAGNIILKSKAGSFETANIRELPELSQLAGQILSTQGGAYRYHRNQHAYQLNVRFIPELGWYLFVEKEEDQALANIRQTLFLNLGICAVVTVIVLILTNLSMRRYQERLRQTSDSHTAQISQAMAEINAAHQARSHMLAYISHDLRAPLATIIHYTHLLNAYADKTAQRYQSAIERSAIHQLELIDDLVEYARGELDRLELLPAPTYIHALLRDIAGQAELLADQQCNRFTLRLSRTIPAIVVIDPKRLRQVLLNLLTNAAKFTQGGDICMGVEAFSQSNTNKLMLHFYVTDTGPGIPDEDFERIFLPFERRKNSRPGSGLGLTIAYQVVRKMGGKLTVESELGKGSRFWFDMEIETAKESDVLQPATAFAMPESFGTGKSILVVDDDSTNRDYLYEILAMADFDVVLAANGEEALQIAEMQSFDILLTDQIMPGIDGWELLRKLHERHPDGRLLSLLCSGMPPERPHDFPKHINFQATLFKPVYPDELLGILKRLLTPEAPLVPPSQTEIAELRKMMDDCDIQGIEGWAGRIEASAPELAPFALSIRNAVERLDFEALENLASIESSRQ